MLQIKVVMTATLLTTENTIINKEDCFFRKGECMEKLIEPPKNWTQLDVPTYLR